MLPHHQPDRVRIAFDDHRLVANAGLILPATLALHLGLPQTRSGDPTTRFRGFGIMVTSDWGAIHVSASVVDETAAWVVRLLLQLRGDLGHEVGVCRCPYKPDAGSLVGHVRDGVEFLMREIAHRLDLCSGLRPYVDTTRFTCVALVIN